MLRAGHFGYMGMLTQDPMGLLTEGYSKKGYSKKKVQIRQRRRIKYSKVKQESPNMARLKEKKG